MQKDEIAQISPFPLPAYFLQNHFQEGIFPTEKLFHCFTPIFPADNLPGFFLKSHLSFSPHSKLELFPFLGEPAFPPASEESPSQFAHFDWLCLFILTVSIRPSPHNL